MVICEEMFTGSNNIDEEAKKLDTLVHDYLKNLLNKTFPNHHIKDTEYSAFKSGLERSLDPAQANPLFSTGLTKLFNPTSKRVFETEIQNTFPQFKIAYLLQKRQSEERIVKDMESHGRLCKKLRDADIILVPNGSPSGTGKYNTREKFARH